MRKLLIAFTCIATIVMTSACSADSVDEITEFGKEADGEIVPPPVPPASNSPQSTGGNLVESGDSDKDKGKS